jgi:hypothetical protein
MPLHTRKKTTYFAILIEPQKAKRIIGRVMVEDYRQAAVSVTIFRVGTFPLLHVYIEYNFIHGVVVIFVHEPGELHCRVAPCDFHAVRH